MERKSMADRRAERAAEEAAAAQWLANNAAALTETVSVEAVTDDMVTLVPHTDMLDADAAADRTALDAAEALGATYRGEA